MVLFFLTFFTTFPSVGSGHHQGCIVYNRVFGLYEYMNELTT